MSAKKKLFKRIWYLRMLNKSMYKELEKLMPNRDLTLELIQAAYRADKKRAKRIHTAIIGNDQEIVLLSKRLTKCV